MVPSRAASAVVASALQQTGLSAIPPWLSFGEASMVKIETTGRMCRGGAWLERVSHFDSMHRDRNRATWSFFYIGFRMVRRG